MIRIEHLVKESAANSLINIGIIRRWRIDRGRTTLSSIPSQVRFILDQFDFFLSTLHLDRIKGKTILEIGPGDAIPHGLLFLGAGAKQYIAVDRFLGNVVSERACALYEGLFQNAPAWIRTNLDAAGFDHHQYPWADSRNQIIKLIPESIETVTIRSTGPVDVIVGFNVVEHLSDVQVAFSHMDEMLRPDGVMLHRIDYGPHDVWRTYANPLTFLTVPDNLWSLMGSNRGYPNRLRHAELLAILDRLQLQSIDRITNKFAETDVAAIRPYLLKRFTQFSDEELQIADAEIISSRSARPMLGVIFNSHLES